jgi:hypothetical protein
MPFLPELRSCYWLHNPAPVLFDILRITNYNYIILQLYQIKIKTNTSIAGKAEEMWPETLHSLLKISDANNTYISSFN